MKTHFVTNERGDIYEVVADHVIHCEHGAVGCSLTIHSIKPTNRMDVAITDELKEELESALAYKIIDEYNDGDNQEFEGYPC